ncbi:MAG: AtpZ/AtpI family protein [Weeksellaceae bacterium]
MAPKKTRIITKVKPDGSTEKVEMHDTRKSHSGLRMEYLNLGGYLMTPLLLGLGLGYAADKALHLDSTFTIIGIVIGTLLLFYNLYSLTKENGS